MKNLNKFQALVKEANELAKENNRLDRLLTDAKVPNDENWSNHEAVRAYYDHDKQAYMEVEGGQIICESAVAITDLSYYFKHNFYFLKNGAKRRSRFSKAKALEALQD
jgi:hypothetical protein